MCEFPSDIINIGQYVILQRKDYKKLHLLSNKTSCVYIGKDKVQLDVVIGKKIGSTFKMIPKVGFNRHFTLQSCSLHDMSSTKILLKDLGSGFDNRSICDDGSSQLLTSDSIEEMRDIGTTPKAIIEQLVENSKTFLIKTEYSQEKYIKKKEKKYYEFITIRRPTINQLAEILYNRDLPKSIGIRIDTLSQLVTVLNYQPDGKYLLIENGFNGIVAATLLNSLSNEGKLIHITPGNQNQKQAVLAMNFSNSHLSCLMTVRLSTMTELINKHSLSLQEDSALLVNSERNVQNLSEINCSELPSIDNGYIIAKSDAVLDIDNEHQIDFSMVDYRKRKHSFQETSCSELTLKKPRWAIEAELAFEVLLKKIDGLIIACKEYPVDILNRFLAYLLPSRPFVIYSLYQEPLVTLYLQLKLRHDIVYLKITDTWLRPYQVLPDRTHPAVTISSSSGYLLSGIKVVNS